jgi:hypothetical protein
MIAVSVFVTCSEYPGSPNTLNAARRWRSPDLAISCMRQVFGDLAK